ncbi:hypothetical protein [Clostridium fungisolvens]|uniref:PIN domain-containing protein n=1 Tax=Clostridium fungisolvens TaxID=1604897 RepID=A0A6V8SMT2_9CLOT|nr:hypothetical protein [Clostridium fungisolvens]GFP76193.1 hypothetical protein bsdtw1_02292 [Clostridium fungisolvens]
MEYLLDTNVVIGLWKQYPFVIDKLIEEKKLRISREVSEELVVKEMRLYKGQQVLSDRFCKLIFFIIETDRHEINKFYSTLDIKHTKNGNTYVDNKNKLSQNDLSLLYTCHLDSNLILVTEDRYLFNAAIGILGEDRVITLDKLVEKVQVEV